MGSNTYITSAGTQITATFQGDDRAEGRIDARTLWFNVNVGSAPPARIPITFDAPDLVTLELQTLKLPAFAEVKQDLGIVGLISTIEADASFQLAASNAIDVSVEQATHLLHRPTASNREIRRYIARKAFAIFERTTLENATMFERADFLILGCRRYDILRNAQVLQEENYLTITAMRQADTVTIVPRALLIRDVERYGAVKADAAVDRDYGAAISAYPMLGPWKAVLGMEWQRYELAVTDVELESVFRAVAPVVEAIAKEALRQLGSMKSHSSLGTVIAEFQERGLGGVPLWTQLNHVLKFSRDLAQHGATMPESVVRIACANAFELVPQLASLVPANAATG